LLLMATGATGQNLEAGKVTYDKYCAQCHGDQGDGQGIATKYLLPEPRDFTAGKYKVRTTPTGALPTDADIERTIRLGFPYTAMPAFRENVISDGELADLVAYIKGFASAFAEEGAPEPITIPQPPVYDAEHAATKGREVYEATGCGACHGALGRGDGGSAPTLVDDWNKPVRVADLTKPWTFRGGGTRIDIFRTMSTGFAGTPMPGIYGALPPEDIWAITDYMLSLSGGPQESEAIKAPYANVVAARATSEEIDLARADELFADAPSALFPLFGQIIEPGRAFFPAANGIQVQAIYNQDEIAFRLVWHDMRADSSGANAPDTAVPSWDEQLAEAGAGSAEDDPWGAAAEDDPWGEDAVAADDPWGDDALSDEEGADDDFWGEANDGTSDGSEFSDAVAIQFPRELPEGVRRPYFVFGDAQNAVDLWFADLAKQEGELWTARGSRTLVLGDGEAPEMMATYDQGAWVVLMKRQRTSRTSITFEPDSFVPISFSVWDGFNRERGNKRALSIWWDLYLEPLERPSPIPPMVKAFFGILALELLIVAIVRWRRRRNATQTATGSPAAQAV
jgi:cytochrome c oxidase cbb3-type subunit 2